MSFQTFTDTAGGKLLPKYLPNNNPATSVLKITQGGNTPIPAPTVNNEQLTIIEQTQGGGQFQVEAYPDPPSPQGEDFVYMGAVPFREGGSEGYFVFGHYQSILGGGIVNGVILKLLIAEPPNWETFATTDAGTTIWCACQLNPTVADGGRPALAQTYVFHGTFTQITDVESGQQTAVANQLVSYTEAGGFVALPLTAGNFDNNQGNWSGGLVLVGIPQPLVAACGEFLIINYTDLVQQGTNLGAIVIYDGGLLKRIGGGVGDEIPQVSSATFDTQNRLWICGEFNPAFPPIVNSITLQQRALLCLSAQGGFFPTVVPFPFTINDQPTASSFILAVANSWNGLSIVINGSGFQVAANGGVATGTAYIDVATLVIAKFGLIDTIPTNELSDSVMVDGDTYITAYFDDNQNFLFGTEAGITATFGKDTYARPQYNPLARVMFWNYVMIAAGIGDLCYSTFAYSSVDGVDGSLYTGNAGAFVAAGGATGVFQNGSKARYIRPDGSAGDAASATFQNSFSTLQLIGDLANNKWDVVGTTGNIVFND